MCRMQELVRVVPDDRLCVDWLTATADDGRRVVFVRQSSQWMIQGFCELGVVACPVFRALLRAA